MKMLSLGIAGSLIICLTSLSFYDLKFYRLPNYLVGMLGALLLIKNILLGGTFAPTNGFFCFILITFLKKSYTFFWHKTALGWGDVKLLSICGLGMEGRQIPLFLLLTGIFGVCNAGFWSWRGWGPLFPLGPSICLAFVCTLWEEICLS